MPKIVRIDKDGKVAATVDIPGVDAAAASNGNGPVWALGYTVKVPWDQVYELQPGVIEGRNADLKAVWKLQLTAAEMKIRRLRQTPDKAGWFVVGSVEMTLDSGMEQPFIYKVTSGGELAWQQRYFGFETKGRLFDVVGLPDNGGIAVGTQSPFDGTYLPMAVRFNASGGLIWKKTFTAMQVGGSSSLSTAVSDGGQGIWALPMEPWGAQIESTALRIDDAGNLVQSHKLGLRVLAMTGKPISPTVTLATSVFSPNPKLTLPATVFRTSGQFATQCKDVGKCYGLAGKLCDDGKPCTTDLCDGAKGCLNSDLSDGVACHDGDSCTVADACAKVGCKAGAPALLSVDVTGIFVESALTAEDGSIYACGTSEAYGSGVVVGNLAPNGAILWKAKLDLPFGARCRLASHFVGQVLFSGHAPEGDFEVTVSSGGIVKTVNVFPGEDGQFIRAQRGYVSWDVAMAGSVATKSTEPANQSDAWFTGLYQTLVIEGPENEIACDIAPFPDGSDAAIISNIKTGALTLVNAWIKKIVWKTPFGGAKLWDPQAEWSAPRMVPTAVGSVLVLSVVNNGANSVASPALRLVEVDAAGKIITDKILADDVKAVQPDILALPSGGYLIAASRNYPKFGALP